jgi:hydroxypyruvate reductase
MGPVGILCIQRTLNKGRWSGFYTGVGAALSDIFYCLLTGFGLSFIEGFLDRHQEIIQIIGSVEQLCQSAVKAAGRLGYLPILLTSSLCCTARDAGSFLASIAAQHAADNVSLAFIAGGETVVQLTGKGLGGRNQEIALSAAAGIANVPGAAVFSVGSDGTDGPTDAAGGYCDYETQAALREKGWDIYETLQNNDAYHALQAVDGLIVTGPTGTNVNDVAVALLKGK